MSSPQEVSLYRVFCIEENKNVTVWSDTVPTLCPNDHTNREIDPIRTLLVDTINKQTVVVEDNLHGNYQVINMKFEIPSGASGSESVHNISMPMDLEIWRAFYKPISAHINDIVSFRVAPDTIIGSINDISKANTNTLSVSPTITAYESNLVKGFEISIQDNDGQNRQDLGRIIGIDREGGIITCENSIIDRDYGVGSVLLINRYIVKDYEITHTDRIVLGEKGLKPMLLDANIPVQMIYKNASGESKNIFIHMEYYYR